jgi:hypothetical protein
MQSTSFLFSDIMNFYSDDVEKRLDRNACQHLPCDDVEKRLDRNACQRLPRDDVEMGLYVIALMVQRNGKC